MRRIKIGLMLIIFTFAFTVASGMHVALAVDPVDPNVSRYDPPAISANDPTTYNIPTQNDGFWEWFNKNPGSAAVGDVGNFKIPETAKEEQDLGFFTNIVTDFLITIVNGIFNIFGLHSVDQLAKNTTGNFWGALTYSDVQIVNSFVVPLTIVAWMVAGVSIQIFSLKLATSTMNARRRASVMDYFQNWFVGAVFLAAGPSAINMIFQASSAIIRSMYMTIGERVFNPIGGITNMLSSPTMGGFGIGTILAGVLYLLVVTGITFMLNFIYLQRYVTLFVYACLSPIFISFYFFDKTRILFWNWIKELIGLAFMPAVHMILIALYVVISESEVGNGNMLLRLVFLVMFIPLSDMVRKMTGVVGGGSGVAENLMGGMGMGIAMQGVRTLTGGVGAAAGGMAEAALFGGGLGSGGKGASGGGSGVSSAPGASRANGGPAGFFGPAMEQAMSAVSNAKSSGSKWGGVAGAVAGGLMGAGTGNMAGIMMGASVGQKAGGGAGSDIAGAISGRSEIKAATGGPVPKGLTKEQRSELQQRRNEAAFGPGPGAPSDMTPEMRQDITERNMATVKGQDAKASSINAQVNTGLDSQRASAHETAGPGSFLSGDSAVSMGYSDHTDHYKMNSAGEAEWLYSTQEGDKRAKGGGAYRTVSTQKPDGTGDKEISRGQVKAGDVKGVTQFSQGWNT